MVAYCYTPGPTKCGTGPRPGAKALLAYAIEQFPGVAGSDGIFNCRNIRGGSSLSLHADGRAPDVHFPRKHPDGDRFFHWCIDQAHVIGAQELIWNHQIWSAHHPYISGYVHGPGGDDHETHVHAGLCLPSANSLTLELLRSLPPANAAAAITVPAPHLVPVEVSVMLPLPVQRIASFGPPIKADPDGVLFVPLPDPKHAGETRWRPVSGLNVLTELIRMGLVSAGQEGRTHEDVGADVFDTTFAVGTKIT